MEDLKDQISEAVVGVMKLVEGIEGSETQAALTQAKAGLQQAQADLAEAMAGGGQGGKTVPRLDDMQAMLDQNSVSPLAFVRSLAGPVRRRVKALKRLQLNYFQLESQFFTELHALECKYEQFYAPLLSKRRDIVSATVEPTDDECDWKSDEEEEDEPIKDVSKVSTALSESLKEKLIIAKPADLAADAAAAAATHAAAGAEEPVEVPRGIPGFWLRIFQNIDLLAERVEAEDMPILKHLMDVRLVVSVERPEMFVIQFEFEPNEFFTNSVLTKEYLMSVEPDKALPLRYDGPDIVKCKGCAIDWKAGKNVTEKQVVKTQRHKTKGTKKTVTKVVSTDSFFNFFSPPEVPEGEEPNGETEDTLSVDFEIAHYLRTQVIPRAVLYYTGDALDSDDDNYDSDDDDREEGTSGDDPMGDEEPGAGEGEGGRS